MPDSVADRILADLWAILIYVGRPTLLGGLALIMLAAIGLIWTRKHRVRDPRDPLKRGVAIIVGLIALAPLVATMTLAAMQQAGLPLDRTYWLARTAKAVPGTEIVAVILLFWLTARLNWQRRSWYAVYGIAGILVSFGGSVLLIYVLR
ncbi:hypothetical protein [uncultured Ferrovibrio sp.]|jgi:membrane protein CcdC involved in cytochrome C biogenesis|uniref:hypothetical protein n=1 Tax=uncultured Ferrovibrio sp. TaxID=1576913 RepID=UPI0026165DFB|nr:hypothetical protein [uncultured Ferrovibrio sp.]